MCKGQAWSERRGLKPNFARIFDVESHVQYIGTMQSLTERQQQALDFICHCISDRGYPPTLREIGAHMGIRSTNGVNDHLRALERKGYLVREDMKSRALRPTDRLRLVPQESANNDNAQQRVVEIPVLGRVAAGVPILADEQVIDTVTVSEQLVGSADNVFSLRISGESMVDAGILDGDYVFVRKQSTANRGQIVVVLLNDEATVKYYFPERDYVRLQPANAQMAPILVRQQDFKETMILGIVVGLFRRV